MKIDVQSLISRHFGYDVRINGFKEYKTNLTQEKERMVNGASIIYHTDIGAKAHDYIKVINHFVMTSENKVVPMGDYLFPLECVVELSQQSVIIEGNIKNRDGTIKEFISRDDWEITIRGMIINYESSNYPVDRVKSFLKVIDTKNILEVESPYLNMFNIDNMVIMSYYFPQPKGALNYQPFEIKCRSDIDYSLST